MVQYKHQYCTNIILCSFFPSDIVSNLTMVIRAKRVVEILYVSDYIVLFRR